jgi:hypothetical protein
MCAKLRVVRPEEPDEPIEKYLADVNAGTTDVRPYERLMIHYRKQKNYKEEVAIINKGIDVLKSFYQRHQEKVFGRRVPNSIKNLSEKISRSTGLQDKKGNTLFLPEPVPKWTKRLSVAEAKLKAQKDKIIGAKKTAKKKKTAGRKR